MHALTMTDLDDPSHMVTLPFELRGVTSLIYVRNVTPDDYNSGHFTQIHLTSETLTWNPQTPSYAEQELAMTNHTGQIVCKAVDRGLPLVISELHSYADDPANVFHDCNFHQVLQ